MGRNGEESSELKQWGEEEEEEVEEEESQKVWMSHVENDEGEREDSGVKKG